MDRAERAHSLVVALTRCVKCGKEFPGEYSYCPNCGAEQTPVAAAAATAPKKGRRGFLKAGIAAIALILLGFLGWHQYGEDLKDWLKRVLGGEPTTTTTTTKPPTTAPATTTPTTTTAATTVPTTTTTATPTATATTTTTTAETPTLVWPIDKPVPPERVWESAVNPYIEAAGGVTTAHGPEGYEHQFFVGNLGDAPSFCTVVELYAGPYHSELWDNPLRDYHLVDRKTVVLHPGESKSISLRYRRAAGTGSGTLVAACYDPLLDPRGFRMESDAPLSTLYNPATRVTHRHVSFGGYVYS